MTATIWDEVNEPKTTAFSNVFYGQVSLSAYYCVLVKGMGKETFDQKRHSEDQRRVAIDMEIVPLTEMNVKWPLQRNTITTASDWSKQILPNIKSLGISAEQLDGMWVKACTIAQLDYKGKPVTYIGNDGTTKQRTTFEFMTLYANEAECRAAFQQDTGAAPAPAVPSDEAQMNAAGFTKPASASSKEREVALKFLPSVIDNSIKGETDLAKVMAQIENNIALNPYVAKHFTANSPEVLELVSQKMHL